MFPDDAAPAILAKLKPPGRVAQECGQVACFARYALFCARYRARIEPQIIQKLLDERSRLIEQIEISKGRIAALNAEIQNFLAQRAGQQQQQPQQQKPPDNN